MKAYFIRRILLLIPTLIGITILVFAVMRLAPGNPVDKALQELAAASEDGGASSDNKGDGPDEAAIEALEEQYEWDKSGPIAYLQWLGVKPREIYKVKSEYVRPSAQPKPQGELNFKEEDEDYDRTVSARVVLTTDGRWVQVDRNGGEVVRAFFVQSGEDISTEGWTAEVESPMDRLVRRARREDKSVSDYEFNPEDKYRYRAVVFKKKFSGLIQGNLGNSTRYADSVWSMILDRVPIALYFGILSTIIIYGVCIPLGVMKAIGHRSLFDNLTSILIFIGYSIPGFALGGVLLVYLGASMEIFPLSGLVSVNFQDMGPWDKFKDLVWHTVLPLICYVISGFAFLTMMMKNNLMDNLSADYVRTAMAKGVSFRKAVIGHAFRNSFIPIATSLGNLVAIFVGGSMLIEKVFDIQGFGMLQFQAISDRDHFLIMGTLTISAFLMLIGNILSDFIVATVDPRIKFN